MLRRVLPFVVAPLFLAGCAETWDVDGVAAMPSQGDAYAKALHKIYVERANFEKKEGDWKDVAFFTERARAAAAGTPAAVQTAEERELGGNAEVAAARAKLTAALSSTAPQDTPEACAMATAWFEHWMEQLEEGWQTNDIAEAKANFDANMPKCVARERISKRYTIYFDFSKATLTGDAHKIVKQIAAEQQAVKPTSIFLKGHTDTVGNPASNEKLSAARVENVAAALAKLGVTTKALDVKYAGETQLAVPTPDQTKEARNRRVEVFFER
jgi:outer membrane protein OmpA-like peptidoglycan-associated protein